KRTAPGCQKGKLSCTRENDPVRDSSGKQHSNKCIMCAEKFSVFSFPHWKLCSHNAATVVLCADAFLVKAIQ
uniref:Kazal-like domain-containing protein n=1 Tax=Anas zonorhyncha TaxID=75864 RepID=A0A8B9VBU3_9AVES